MNDNRRTPRVNINEWVQFHNSKSFITARVLNISTGGMFIQTDDPLPIDAQFAIRLRIPGEPQVMDLQGRVVWTKRDSASFPAGMGVQYCGMSHEQEEKIRSFIDARLNQCTG